MTSLKTVGVKELKNNLSAYLREVRRGVRVFVADRQQVVAELREPGSVPEAVLDPTLAAWVEAGEVRLPRPPRHRYPSRPSAGPTAPRAAGSTRCGRSAGDGLPGILGGARVAARRASRRRGARRRGSGRPGGDVRADADRGAPGARARRAPRRARRRRRPAAARAARARRPGLGADGGVRRSARARGGGVSAEPVRTLDAVHLSTALLFAGAYPDLAMLTFDERVARNAEALGLGQGAPRLPRCTKVPCGAATDAGAHLPRTMLRVRPACGATAHLAARAACTPYVRDLAPVSTALAPRAETAAAP